MFDNCTRIPLPAEGRTRANTGLTDRRGIGIVRPHSAPHRGVAQPGSAFAWGAKGLGFKSPRPDHLSETAFSASQSNGFIFVTQRVTSRAIDRPALHGHAARSYRPTVLYCPRMCRIMPLRLLRLIASSLAMPLHVSPRARAAQIACSRGVNCVKAPCTSMRRAAGPAMFGMAADAQLRLQVMVARRWCCRTPTVVSTWLRPHETPHALTPRAGRARGDGAGCGGRRPEWRPRRWPRSPAAAVPANPTAPPATA